MTMAYTQKFRRARHPDRHCGPANRSFLTCTANARWLLWTIGDNRKRLDLDTEVSGQNGMGVCQR